MRPTSTPTITLTELDTAIAERLAEHDLRYTATRQAIVAALRDVLGPVTLPELVDAAALPTSSAYRNLAQLEEAGVVHRIVTTGDHARYELAESLAGHHHHLVCDTCGDVRDVTLDDALERRLHTAFESLADADGFTLHNHTIDLHGTCTNCT